MQYIVTLVNITNIIFITKIHYMNTIHCIFFSVALLLPCAIKPSTNTVLHVPSDTLSNACQPFSLTDYVIVPSKSCLKKPSDTKDTNNIKKIKFAHVIIARLIPNQEELRSAGITPEVWYTKNERKNIKDSFLNKLTEYVTRPESYSLSKKQIVNAIIKEELQINDVLCQKNKVLLEITTLTTPK